MFCKCYIIFLSFPFTMSCGLCQPFYVFSDDEFFFFIFAFAKGPAISTSCLMNFQRSARLVFVVIYFLFFHLDAKVRCKKSASCTYFTFSRCKLNFRRVFTPRRTWGNHLLDKKTSRLYCAFSRADTANVSYWTALPGKEEWITLNHRALLNGSLEQGPFLRAILRDSWFCFYEHIDSKLCLLCVCVCSQVGWICG